MQHSGRGDLAPPGTQETLKKKKGGEERKKTPLSKGIGSTGNLSKKGGRKKRWGS